MRHLLGSLALGFAFTAVACGDDSSTTGSGGGGGGSTSGETTATTSGPTTSSVASSSAQTSSSDVGTGGTGGTGGQGTGGEGTGGEGTGGSATCTEIVAVDGGPSSRLFVRLDVDVELDDPEAGDAIAVADFGPGTGAFDLSEETNIAEAQHIVVLVSDVANADLDGARYFMQTSGTLTIDTPPDPDSQYYFGFAGSIDDVTLFEATIEDDGTTTFVDGGECFHVAHAAFDATGYETACEAVTDLDPPSGGACDIGEGSACNPVTNEPCEADEACDLDGETFLFGCFPSTPGDVALCETCSNVDGVFCQAGLTCSGGTGDGLCHRYCCSDEDCGDAGICLHASFTGDIGICITPAE